MPSGFFTKHRRQVSKGQLALKSDIYLRDPSPLFPIKSLEGGSIPIE